MCVIIVANEVKPELELLEKAYRTNNNGCGIAWVENNYVCWKKGIDLTVNDIYQISQNMPLPQIIHFRKTSIGRTCNELCHPFPISSNVLTNKTGKSKKVLFHNGTLREYKNIALQACIAGKLKPLKGEISDSRYLALFVHTFGDEFLELIIDDDKVALFDSKEIKLFGAWYDEANLKLSNTTFLRTQTQTVSNFNASKSCPLVGKENECKYRSYTRCSYIHNKCPYSVNNIYYQYRDWI